MVGELVAADEGTQTTSLWIRQLSALAPSGFNNAAHTTLATRGTHPDLGEERYRVWDSHPLISYPIGAIDRTRTCYLSLTKRAHGQLCFDGWCIRQESNLRSPVCETGVLTN